jgi:hypothetical protein
MLRNRFLSLTPDPTTYNGHSTTASCHSSPTPVKKRALFLMQSGNYNNRFNKSEASTSSNGTAAAESLEALSEESLSLKQHYVDSMSTATAHSGQTKRQRRVSSYLDSDYVGTTGEDIQGIQYAQDQVEGDDDKIEVRNFQNYAWLLILVFFNNSFK